MPLNSTFIAPSFGENGWKPRFPELIGEGAQGAWCAGRFTIYRSRFYYSLVPSWTGNMWNALCFFSIYHVEASNICNILEVETFHFLFLLSCYCQAPIINWWNLSVASYPIQASDLSPKNNFWHRCEAHRKAPGTNVAATGWAADFKHMFVCYKGWEVFQDCRN